jgi:hypothetical protein
MRVVFDPSFLELVDFLSGLGLGEVVADLLVRFFGQRVHVRALGTGHRLVAGRPIVGILFSVRAFVFLSAAINHGFPSSTFLKSVLAFMGQKAYHGRMSSQYN